MALRWIDGFDHYGSSTYSNRVYGGVDNWGSLSGNSRTGSYAIQSDYDTGVLNLDGMLGWQPTEIWVGVAIKKDSSYALPSNPLLIANYSYTQYHGRVNINGDYSISIVDSTGSTIATSSPSVISTSAWTYIELYVKMGSGGSGAAKIRVNGRLLLEDTTGDYLYGSATYIKYVSFHAPANNRIYYDDFYVDDSQFNGPIRVKTFFPDSDGTHTDFERNTGSNDYECIDEASPDGDTTYIEGDREGDKSTFGYTLTDVVNPILGVQINPCVRKTTGGASVSIATLARVSSSDYNDSGEVIYLPESYTHYGRMFALNPDTSTAWTKTSVEAAEFGVEIASLSTTTTTTTTT